MESDIECKNSEAFDSIPPVSFVSIEAAADDIDFDLSSPGDNQDMNNSFSLLSAIPVSDVPTIIISDSACADRKTCSSQKEKIELQINDIDRGTNAVTQIDDRKQSNGGISEDSTHEQDVISDIDRTVNDKEEILEYNETDRSNVRAPHTEEGVDLQVSAEFFDIVAAGGEGNAERELTALKEINSDMNTKDELELEEEAINLDNILMREKQESDSDSEFDFDLPSAPTSKMPEVSKVDGQKSVLTEVSKKEEPRSEPATGTEDTTDVAVSVSPKPKPLAFVKPTPQALGFSYSLEKKVAEPEKQKVLEAAQDEWDKVTTIQPGTEPAVVQTMPSISPYELSETLMLSDFTHVRSSIKRSVERRGFAAFINLLFGPPKLARNLIDERDKVFCIAASPLDNENSSHIRTLQTIYRCLTGSKFDCPRVGSHWEEIGFQGSDPATDLRGGGLLGLLNLLYFLRDPKKQALASDIYRLSLHPTQNFPFCVMGINMTKITLQTMREEVLNKECNRRGDILSVVNEFYVALYLQLYQVWKGQGKTISDSGYVIKDLEMRAKKNPRGVLKNLQDYLHKKTTIVTDKTTNLGGDDFVNVCD